MLDEQTIKKSSLQFLKAYYKYRPRVGETTSSYDMVTETGALADGYLSFATPHGNFLATFEASSVTTAEEVKYVLQRSLLFWDGLCAASITGAIAFTAIFAFDRPLIRYAGWQNALGILLVCIFFLFLCFRLLVRRHRRYRYLYAIEQFKSYYADEQWVAIGSDVFPDSENHYLQELRRQCIENGFGLLMVYPDLEVQVVATPARMQVLPPGRKHLRFLSQAEWISRLTQKQFVPWTLRWKKRLSLFAGRNPLYRYGRSVNTQAALSALAFAAISTICYREYADRPKVYLSPEDFARHLRDMESHSFPEPEEYFPDSSIFEAGQWHWLTLPDEDENYEVDGNNTADRQQPATARPLAAKKDSARQNRPSPSLWIGQGNGQYLTYDCERLELSGTRYLIKDTRWPSLDKAMTRMKALEKAGLRAGCIWNGCISREGGFTVFLDELYDNKSEAYYRAIHYQQTLTGKQLGSELKLLTIER